MQNVYAVYAGSRPIVDALEIEVAYVCFSSLRDGGPFLVFL